MEFLAENHPRVVHFAVAFLTAYPFFELLALIFRKEYLEKSAHIILFIAVLSALGAVLTGNQAEVVAHEWEEMGAIIPFNTIHEHSDYANLTLWYFTAILLFRTLLVIKKKFYGWIRYLVILLAFVGMYFIYQTGEYGGRLVYKYGVGTELKKQETLEDTY
jgi:uncharacterized membrane protein